MQISILSDVSGFSHLESHGLLCEAEGYASFGQNNAETQHHFNTILSGFMNAQSLPRDPS